MLITFVKEVMFFLQDCLPVCQQDNWKSYGPMFVKFYGNVMNGKNYKWLKFFLGGVIQKECWIIDDFEIFISIALNGA